MPTMQIAKERWLPSISEEIGTVILDRTFQPIAKEACYA
jgi:hypothetical protein